MMGIIIIAACLVVLNRMLFRGQLVSLFIDGCRQLISAKEQPPKKSEPTPPTTPPAAAAIPVEIIVAKRYVSGPERTAAAKPSEVEQSDNRDVIFAPNASREPLGMGGWGELDTSCITPALDADGEPVGTEEPILPVNFNGRVLDPEVAAQLNNLELEPGERIFLGDATQAERQAIENFDVQAFR